MKRITKKIKHQCILLLLPYAFVVPAKAAELDDQLGKTLTLQLGYFGAYQGESQAIGIEGSPDEVFHVTHHRDQNLLAGIGYYIHGLKNKNLLLKYGINAFYFAPTTVSGTITQEEHAATRSYHYKLTHYPIYFDAKTFVNGNKKYPNLTFDLGVGPTIMDSYGYQERSLDGGITAPADTFSGKTQVAFSATAGLGLSFCLKDKKGECLPVELGYRFFYLGEGKLEKTSHQVSTDLETGHNIANALVLSIFM